MAIAYEQRQYKTWLQASYENQRETHEEVCSLQCASLSNAKERKVKSHTAAGANGLALRLASAGRSRAKSETTCWYPFAERLSISQRYHLHTQVMPRRAHGSTLWYLPTKSLCLSATLGLLCRLVQWPRNCQLWGSHQLCQPSAASMSQGSSWASQLYRRHPLCSTGMIKKYAFTSQESKACRTLWYDMEWGSMQALCW